LKKKKRKKLPNTAIFQRALANTMDYSSSFIPQKQGCCYFPVSLGQPFLLKHTDEHVFDFL